MLTRVGLISPLVVAALVAAGCGSSSSSSSTTAAAATTGSSASTTSASSSAATATGTPVSLTTKPGKKLGVILAAGPKKKTVYLYEKDKGSTSACTGACASVWPPVTGKASVAGAAKASDLGTITRSDGATQVTYKGHPLYFFAKDKDAGDSYGQNLHSFGADWYVLAPSGNKVG